MIVGKVEHPTTSGAGISLGYDVGSSNFKGSALNSQFKSFDFISVASSVGMGLAKNGYNLNVGYSYRYSSYSKEREDPQDENKIIKIESFKSINHGPYIGTSKILYRNTQGTILGIDFGYTPFLQKRFISVNTLPGRQLKVDGHSYGVGLFFAIRFMSCDVSFNYSDFKQDLIERKGMFGCGVGVSF